MLTAPGCREFAEQCLGWAKKTANPDQQKAFLDMARTWTQAATQLEVGFGPIDEPPTMWKTH